MQQARQQQRRQQQQEERRHRRRRRQEQEAQARRSPCQQSLIAITRSACGIIKHTHTHTLSTSFPQHKASGSCLIVIRS